MQLDVCDLQAWVIRVRLFLGPKQGKMLAGKGSQRRSSTHQSRAARDGMGPLKMGDVDGIGIDHDVAFLDLYRLLFCRYRQPNGSTGLRPRTIFSSDATPTRGSDHGEELSLKDSTSVRLSLGGVGGHLPRCFLSLWQTEAGF